jgi:hypothetical protein
MNELAALDQKLPAHIAKLGQQDEDWGSGTTAGFPIISTKGKVFHIKRGDESTMVEDPNEAGEAARSLNVVIIKTHKGVTKTFYAKNYEEGSVDKPDCHSLDGVVPAPDAEDKQCKTCAACDMNKWGSRKTESGKDAKRCNDVKRLAVAPVGQLNDPMLLRVPPTSLRTWDQYVDMLHKRNVSPAQVVTKIKFDPLMAHQALLFEAVDFISDTMVDEIVEAMGSTVVDSMLGGVQAGEADYVPAKDQSAPVDPPKKRSPKTPKEVPVAMDTDAVESAIVSTTTDGDVVAGEGDVDLGDFAFDDEDFDFGDAAETDD